ncbi:MAG: GDSL-type esterase/lipase family protein [Gammaproteobacteria bacterium]
MKSPESRRITPASLLQALGLAVAGLAAALVLAELMLRLVPQALPVALQIALSTGTDGGQVADPVIGNRLPPNTTGAIRTQDFVQEYRTDSHGFRNEEPWPEQADIVVIGDSLVFGYGVKLEQAWPQRLAQLLGRNVVNLGLIGAGPQQFLRIYQAVAEPLNPRLIVVGMFPRNDFWDANLFDQWLKQGAQGNYMRWRDGGRSNPNWRQPRQLLRQWLNSHSYLYGLIRFAGSASRSRAHPVPLEWHGTTLQLAPGDFAHATEHDNPADPVFALAIQELVGLREAAAKRGAKVLVVLQPSKEETYMPLAGGSVADASAPVVAALDKAGIEHLDLGPVFRERAAAGDVLFFPTDGHPNADGYRLTATVVAQRIAESDARP